MNQTTIEVDGHTFVWRWRTADSERVIQSAWKYMHDPACPFKGNAWMDLINEVDRVRLQWDVSDQAISEMVHDWSAAEWEASA